MASGAKILIIENEPELREMLQEELEADGYSVEAFDDGRPALERLQKNPETCLVLLDMVMPVMNGWEFMHEFLKLPVTILPIPVYLVSVVNDLEKHTKTVGATGFTRKPVSLEILLRIVRDHCEKDCEAA